MKLNIASSMLPSASSIMEAGMIPISDLFEAHLTVVDLGRSMTFYGQVLGLELAEVFPERKVAFYWIGGRGSSMLDFVGTPTDEPVVLAWMPAASIYFRDPDGNQLELLSMLPDAPQPVLGVVSWSRWS